MAGKIGVVVVEIDAKNRDARFVPLGRVLRGRWNWRDCREPGAFRLASHWDADIPGQRIEIDPASGTAAVLEPLFDSEHALLREKVLRSGRSLPPAREEFANVHAPTWLFWIKRLVESGAARVILGRLPENPGEPQLPKSYQPPRPEESSLLAENATLRDQLAAMRSELAEIRAALPK